jgi:hypothetical protein
MGLMLRFHFAPSPPAMVADDRSGAEPPGDGRPRPRQPAARTNFAMS